MTPQDVADRIKRQFGDESGVQVQDADILRWINDAQRDIVVKHNLLQRRGTLPTVAGTSDYGAPANMLALHSLKYNDTRLAETSIQEADLSGLGSTATSGTPQTYVYFAETITLYPTPDAAGTLTVLYTELPAAVTSLAGTLGIPEQYHNLIVQYALGQAYEMDENWQAAQVKNRQYAEDMAELRSRKDTEPEEFYPFITYSGDRVWSYYDGMPY